MHVDCFSRDEIDITAFKKSHDIELSGAVEESNQPKYWICTRAEEGRKFT